MNVPEATSNFRQALDETWTHGNLEACPKLNLENSCSSEGTQGLVVSTTSIDDNTKTVRLKPQIWELLTYAAHEHCIHQINGFSHQGMLS